MCQQEAGDYKPAKQSLIYSEQNHDLTLPVPVTRSQNQNDQEVGVLWTLRVRGSQDEHWTIL